MSSDQLKELLEKIEAAHEQNTAEHKVILDNAKSSAELAEKIEDVLSKWSTFWSVVMGIRNVVFTITFIMAMSYFVAKWADVFTGMS